MSNSAHEQKGERRIKRRKKEDTREKKSHGKTRKQKVKIGKDWRRREGRRSRKSIEKRRIKKS